MAQEQVQRQGTKRDQQEVEEVEAKDVQNEQLAQSTEDTLGDIDELLGDVADDEILRDIDDILEENAEDFVNGYVQQGGQ